LLRDTNPFTDHLLALNRGINPYVDWLIAENQAKESTRVFLGRDLKRAGNWRQTIFPEGKAIASDSHDDRRLTPLIVEVGCHTGKTITRLAAAHPHWQFIGMDVTYKRVVLTAKRIEENKLSNAITLLANAMNMDILFSDQELDCVLIFFPDPWVKKRRQRKHQLLNLEFCRLLSRKLLPGGMVWVKTDQQGYFEQTVENLGLAGFKKREKLANLTISEPTIFEKRFLERGIQIQEGQFTND
jgi:tRNA (guanine-N7-)-methyltransferase